MKYITISTNGNLVMIIFSDATTHLDMAKEFGDLVRTKSAGMILRNGENFYCGGESVSLRMKPGRKDNNLLALMGLPVKAPEIKE